LHNNHALSVLHDCRNILLFRRYDGVASHFCEDQSAVCYIIFCHSTIMKPRDEVLHVARTTAINICPYCCILLPHTWTIPSTCHYQHHCEYSGKMTGRGGTRVHKNTSECGPLHSLRSQSLAAHHSYLVLHAHSFIYSWHYTIPQILAARLNKQEKGNNIRLFSFLVKLKNHYHLKLSCTVYLLTKLYCTLPDRDRQTCPTLQALSKLLH
jgi:hypothetical protein